MLRPALPPGLEATHLLHERGAYWVLVRRDWEAALPVGALLDGAPVGAWGEVQAHGLRGRGPIHLVRTARGVVVAKRYERGGVLGGLLRHRYGDPERPLREAWVAEQLARRGCRTPCVVVARGRRTLAGLWELEIGTEFLHGAVDLLHALERRPAEAARLAETVGRTLRRVQDAGLDHRDLQVRNLLVGPEPYGDLAIIDLDRCRVRPPLSAGRRMAALARFARSLVKQGVLPADLSGRRRDLRLCLVFARQALRPSHRTALRQILRTTARAVARHRWSWGQQARTL